MGKRPDLREAIYVFIDAGIGGCLVSNGEILRGHAGCAGEIGHIIVGENGYFSPTKVSGTLESYVARQAVLSHYRKMGGTANSISMFISDLDAGKDDAKKVLADWSYHLGRGVATLTSILNPERVVFGGSVARLFGYAEDSVVENLRAHLMPYSFEPILERSKSGMESPAIGAARMLHRDFFAQGTNEEPKYQMVSEAR